MSFLSYKIVAVRPAIQDGEVGNITFLAGARAELNALLEGSQASRIGGRVRTRREAFLDDGERLDGGWRAKRERPLPPAPDCLFGPLGEEDRFVLLALPSRGGRLRPGAFPAAVSVNLEPEEGDSSDSCDLSPEEGASSQGGASDEHYASFESSFEALQRADSFALPPGGAERPTSEQGSGLGDLQRTAFWDLEPRSADRRQESRDQEPFLYQSRVGVPQRVPQEAAVFTAELLRRAGGSPEARGLDRVGTMWEAIPKTPELLARRDENTPHQGAMPQRRTPWAPRAQRVRSTLPSDVVSEVMADCARRGAASSPSVVRNTEDSSSGDL
jgi:hypothetical protein